MVSGWRYRIASVVGTATLSAIAVFYANTELIQRALVTAPPLSTLPVRNLAGTEFHLVMATTILVMCSVMVPLFKPQPRRILDTLLLAQKRVFVGLIALAAIGYFDFSYRLPRTTLLFSGVLLSLWIPAWCVAIRHQPRSSNRAVLIGDDRENMQAILSATALPVIGYVSPTPRRQAQDESIAPYADGGKQQHEQPAVPVTNTQSLATLDNLGGLSRLSDVLVDYDVDTALLAFSEPDRAEFFGTLDTCYRNGVSAMVHRDHADGVLTTGITGDKLVEIDLVPWDLQDRVTKRVFDVLFSVVALLLVSPLVVLIAIAIKLDSPGPVFYGQERTAEFGETFQIYKFRSMVPDAEADTGATLCDEDNDERDDRVTRVGRVLRQTHIDEIPQLWSILKGDMSVVGPRPERPELELDMEDEDAEWRRRWFVKPGLTGLAQINNVTGFDPGRKLRYDVEYIQKQSFWFDLKIVIRQLWLVLGDAYEMVVEPEDP
jgi:lipopolysaccharide/colanic/teichoic acid biosynthesis glycosyltransferase